MSAQLRNRSSKPFCVITPFCVCISLVLGTYMLIFVGANYWHFMDGYEGKVHISENKRLFALDCDDRTHIQDTVPNECDYWRIMVTAGPWRRGFENLQKHFVGCLLWSCTDLVAGASHTLGFSSVVWIVAVIVAIPLALYVRSLMDRTMAGLGRPARRLGPEEGNAGEIMWTDGNTKQQNEYDDFVPLDSVTARRRINAKWIESN
jgi:hypothetical protein